jgi:hypothetical protein
MRAAQAALQTGAALFHAQWLAKNSPPSTSAADSDSTNSPVAMEGRMIAFVDGYPDVGGDGGADSLNTAAAMLNSGILLAAGGLGDYIADTSPDKDTITIIPDASHPNCKVTYSEPAVVGSAPVINDVGIDAVNGPVNCK